MLILCQKMRVNCFLYPMKQARICGTLNALKSRFENVNAPDILAEHVLDGWINLKLNVIQLLI